MTATTAEVDDLSEGREHKSAVYQAALTYAERGWPVLPGSVWNGRRHVVPGTPRTTNGLRPLIARNLASVDVRTVKRWWSRRAGLEPSVLLRSGETFNLVSVTYELAKAAIPIMESCREVGPVLYQSGEERVYFLVQPGTLLSVEHMSPTDVVSVPPGEWVAAPPTEIGNAADVRWWPAPEPVGWRPVDIDVLADVLAPMSRSRSTP